MIKKCIETKQISILSLYAEGDIEDFVPSDMHYKFQSSPSMQRETNIRGFRFSDLDISILSLYAEGDI